MTGVQLEGAIAKGIRRRRVWVLETLPSFPWIGGVVERVWCFDYESDLEGYFTIDSRGT